MRRTALGVALAVGILAAPPPAGAQQPKKMPVVGFLANIRSPATEGFQQGLRELGYVEGQTIMVEWRLAQGRFDRLPELAVELIALNADVIVAPASPYVRAAMQATKTIPIVFALVPDPVAAGFVASLARPGANITGLSSVAWDLAAKRLQILKETIPGARRIGVFTDVGAEPAVSEIERAAKALGIHLDVVTIREPKDLEAGFLAVSRAGAAAVIEVPGSPIFYAQRGKIADLALKKRLPILSDARESVEAGALMTYTASYPDLMRRSASYVHRILKGAKPADLPVEQPTKFELVINLKTAKALGLTIPQSVLLRADHVIQ